MKKIVIETPEETVGLQQILKNKSASIGFIEKNHESDIPDYGILIPEKYNSNAVNGKFYAKALKYFSSGNCWESKGKYSATIQQWMEFFGPHTEFLFFETEKEMFQWMAQHS